MKMRVTLLHIVLVLAGALTVFPFVWMVLSAFKSNAEIASLDQTLLPQSWTLENFQSIQTKLDFFRLFANSLFLSTSITALAVYTSLLGGFVFAKYRFRGRGALFGVILSTMMITWAVVIIPRYTMFRGSSQKAVDQGSEAAGVEETSGDVVGHVAEPSGGAAEMLE